MKVLEETIVTGDIPIFFMGNDGKDGADGKDGSHGKDGSNGKDGANGNNGANGKSGSRKKDGSYSKGSNGKDGTNGRDGTNGKDGTDGKDATDAKDGTDGTDGKDVDISLVLDQSGLVSDVNKKITVSNLVTINSSGGRAGVGGKGGKGGRAGKGGRGGSGGSAGRGGSGGSGSPSGQRGQNGSSGDRGSNGQDGRSGHNGTDGQDGIAGNAGDILIGAEKNIYFLMIKQALARGENSGRITFIGEGHDQVDYEENVYTPNWYTYELSITPVSDNNIMHIDTVYSIDKIVFTNNSPFDLIFPEITFTFSSDKVETTVMEGGNIRLKNMAVPKGKFVSFKPKTTFSFSHVGNAEAIINLEVNAKDGNQKIPMFGTSYQSNLNFLFKPFEEDNVGINTLISNINSISYQEQIKQIESSILSALIKQLYYYSNTEEYPSILDVNNQTHKILIAQFINSTKTNYKADNPELLEAFDHILNYDGFISISKMDTASKLYKLLLNKPYPFNKSEIENSQLFINLLILAHPIMDEQYTIISTDSKLYKNTKKEIKKSYLKFSDLVEDKIHFEEAQVILDSISIPADEKHNNEAYGHLLSETKEILNKYHTKEYKEMLFKLIFSFLLKDKMVTLAEKKYIRTLIESLGIVGIKEEYPYIYEDNDTTLGINLVAKFKRSILLPKIGRFLLKSVLFIAFNFISLVIILMIAGQNDSFSESIVNKVILFVAIVSAIFIFKKKKDKSIIKTKKILKEKHE